MHYYHYDYDHYDYDDYHCYRTAPAAARAQAGLPSAEALLRAAVLADALLL